MIGVIGATKRNAIMIKASNTTATTTETKTTTTTKTIMIEIMMLRGMYYIK